VTVTGEGLRTWGSAPAAWVILVILASGCGRGDDQRTDSVTRDVVERARSGLDPALVAHLDSGNAAVRTGELERALRHYRSATEIDPDAAAAWFGVYMAAGALGRVDEAGDALERARRAAPGATLLRPDTVP